MDGDLTAALESVLSDPAKMEKVTAMAKDLFAQSGQSGQNDGEGSQAAAAEADAPSSGAPANASPAGDAAFLSSLGKLFSGAGGGGKSRSTALLMAMRPYMKPEKQAKLDRAMQIARMANIAGLVMKEYGGGGHGI